MTVGDSTSLEQNRLAAASGAPDSVRCPGWSTSQTGRFRVFLGSSTKNHWTVRCATRLSGEPSVQRSTPPTVDCGTAPAVCSARSQKTACDSQVAGLSGVPPDYPVCHEDRRLQRSTTRNPNGRLTWHTPNNE
jgi:hypothetical protein